MLEMLNCAVEQCINEVVEFQNCEQMLGILAFQYNNLESDSDDASDEEEFKTEERNGILQSIILFGGRLEELNTDMIYITEPVERRFLRFHSPEIQERFTIYFRFRQDEMGRLMTCFRLPTEFFLDNGS